ncbi:hypothetical protein JCM10449v2_004932 [Rhodotorula kratochvilovae]
MDPSPSSSAPPPPRASFASLPLELVKQIVAEVHEQDKQLSSGQRIKDAGSSAYGPRRELVGPTVAQLEEGATVMWSYWYGRGTVALSYVSKKLRELALPFLVETITTNQLASPFALTELPDLPMASMIRRLDLSKPEDNMRLDSFSICAAALHALTNVETVTIGPAMCQAMHCIWEQHDAAAQATLARRAFARLAPHLTTLAVRAHTLGGIEDVVRSLTVPSVLRHLSWTAANNLFVLPFAFSGQFLMEHTLETLSVNESTYAPSSRQRGEEDVHSTWFDGFYMPSIKSFTYSSKAPLPARFFDRRHCVGSDGHRGVSLQHLPHLRTITLAGNLSVSPTFLKVTLHSLPSSPLESIIIVHPLQDTALETLAWLFPATLPLPPSLRSIFNTARVPSPVEEVPYAALASGRVDHAVRVVLGREAPTVRYQREIAVAQARRRDGDDAGARAVLLASAREALREAEERVEALDRMCDTGGLLELVRMMRPLRERQGLDEL